MIFRLPLCGAIALAALVAVAPSVARAQAVNPATPDFFEKKVRPVLSQNCYKCHSSTSEKLKGGLKLDSREAALKGGDSGPALVAGNPAKSLILQAVRSTDPDKQMPPRGKLTEAQIADLEQWVKAGAVWPGGGAARPAVAGVAKTSGPQNITGIGYDQLKREHWAWQPVRAAQPPAVKNAAWPFGAVDKFVLAKLEQKNLKPVGDADRATLIRRVTFDLTGLPPNPSEVEGFAKDAAPDAFEKVVDRLLASPQFGERWGRHWLDVARYAESTGSARNVPYNHAWRYRDYVIDSFNHDKPYNQFVTEQLAGDLLPATADPVRHNEQLVATGFLAFGVKDLNEKDHLKFTMDNVDEQIDVMSRSLLATTVACARCHDHKFDPIPTADYYALAGIFRSTEILSGIQGKGKGNGKNYDAPDLLLKLAPVTPGVAPAPAAVATSASPSPGNAPAIKALTAKLDKANAELQAMQEQLSGGKKAREKLLAAGQRPAQLRKQLEAKQGEVDGLRKELDALQGVVTPSAGTASASAAPAAASDARAVGVREGVAADCPIFIKGETDDRGPVVPRGFVSVVRFPGLPTLDRAHSGRRELAQWVTSPANPLTARVMANRVWEHLFGEGIVRTVDNFGTTGDAPSHPELLDYLATEFVKNNWSTKKLIREVVLSHAYRLAGTYDTASAAVEPGDRLIWRMNPRRLEAEEIRDAMLATSGHLDLARPVGSPAMNLPIAEIGKAKANARRGGRDGAAGFETHRSVYLPVIRNLVPEALDVFDFAEPTMVTGERDVTTVATQALFLMNNPFVMDQARGLGERVTADPKLDDAARADLAYRLTIARPATAAERQRATQYVTALLHDPAAKDAAKARTDAWASLCQALFASAEFRYVN